MLDQQGPNKTVPVARIQQVQPSPDDLVAVAVGQALQPLPDCVGLVEPVLIVGDGVRHPRFDRRMEADTVGAAQRVVQVLWDEQLPDLWRLRFDPDRPRRVKPAQGRSEAAVKAARRGLAVAGSQAEHRTLVVGQPFEVQHLSARCGQRFEEPGLARSGLPGDNPKPKPRRIGFQLCHHVLPVALVSPLQRVGQKADFGQHQRHRS